MNVSRSSRRRRWPLAALVPIVALAAFFRFGGLHWDAHVRQVEGEPPLLEEQHLHPDERFLTMVTSALEYPDSVGGYFDTARSPMNPHNKGYGFFAYGTFPIFFTRAVADVLDAGGYDAVHIVGRVLSATAGLVTVLLLFSFGRRLYGDAVGLLAALLYGMAALPIQQAHFYTVDEFANPFVLLGLYAALNVQERGNRGAYVAFGLALGTAMACKMPVFTLSLVAAAAALSRVTAPAAPAIDGAPSASGEASTFARARVAAMRLALAAVVAFAVFRVLQPYAFAGPGVLGMSLSDAWWANMQEVRELMSGARDYPPGHQWTNRAPLWFPWRNMVTVGLGPALGLAAWAGWAWAGFELLRRRERRHLVPWVWVTIVFLHQGSQWVKSLRYLLPIYPMLALFAAWLVVRVWRWGAAAAARDRLASPARWRRPAAIAVAVTVVVGTLLWAWATSSIYRRPHSRIEASRWIYDHVPPGAAIGNEVWDDALPLRINGKDGFSIYRGVELHNYAEDSPEKLANLLAALEQSDYVVLSSNRLYGSIPRLPMRYPIMVRYYRALFSGELGFERVAEFTSYPRLFGIDFPDQSAEEAWSVYDHPRVQIFAKTPRWSTERARALLGDGIDWDGIQRLWPRDVTRFKDLMMETSLLEAQRRGGTWSSAAGGMFASAGVAARHPAAVWIAVLALCGAIGFPLAFAAMPGLPDRGFLASRAIGLLLVAYTAWLLASLRWVPFTRGGAWLACGVVAAVAAVVGFRQRRALGAFVAANWRLLVTEEVVFWGFFAVSLAIRFGNPDLWHAARGGEKPMDFAYLNAITKSTWFPPYDPWFAGGYMNYYYFGFVLVATLIKLTAVVPGVAYNLAVPTFYAMVAAGAFVAAGALARAVRRAAATTPWGQVRALVGPGLLAAIFVALAGNFAEVRLVALGFLRMSGAALEGATPLWRSVAAMGRGAARWARGEFESFPFPDDWWFWSASRAIEHPPGEPPPITEFPFFTFLFADLHAHLMALPIALLALTMVTALVLRPNAGSPEASAVAGAAAPARVRGLARVAALARAEGPALLLLAFAVGALWPTNSWDFPTYLVLAGAALIIVELERRGRWSLGVLWAAGARVLLVAALARVLYLPFSLHFATAYDRPQLWEGSRTLFVDFLTVHGVFLFFVVSYLVARLELLRAAGDAYRLARARRRWSSRRAVLARRLVRAGRGDSRRAIASAALLVLPLGVGLALARLTVEGLVVAIGLAAIVELLARPHGDGAGRLVAAMIALAAGLALTVEHLVVAGDIGRMNTVFKSYLQIWTFWGVAAAVGAAVVWARRPRSWTWATAAVALVLAVLLYPALATPARLRDRFDVATERGLDGERFLALGVFHDAGGQIPLRLDQEAFAWLRENVVGSPVVLEASVPPYRWGSRVSVYTGLPTVIGWDWHQRQQRAVRKDDAVGRRLRDVQQIYTTTDIDQALALLRRYQVSYVYVGPVERLYYAGPGLSKFETAADRGLEQVFQNRGVSIYRVGDDPRMSSR